MVQDQSGFVPVKYHPPLPLMGTLFALFGATRFLGQPVEVRGWFFRSPGPMLELRDVVAADGTRTNGWWVAAKLASSAVALVGLVMLAAALFAR